jgi:hypothetical protein
MSVTKPHLYSWLANVSMVLVESLTLYAPELLAYCHFRQSVLYCQDYTFNGCSGGANGCEKSAKCAGGREGALRRTGSWPKCASGCWLCGLGAKMGSFGIFVHGFDASGGAMGGTGDLPL